MLNSRKHEIPSARSKKSGKSIGHDEPVFLLRAKDVYSVQILREYAYCCPDEDHFDAIMAIRKDFEEWQKQYPELVTEPKV